MRFSLRSLVGAIVVASIGPAICAGRAARQIARDAQPEREAAESFWKAHRDEFAWGVTCGDLPDRPVVELVYRGSQVTRDAPWDVGERERDPYSPLGREAPRMSIGWPTEPFRRRLGELAAAEPPPLLRPEWFFHPVELYERLQRTESSDLHDSLDGRSVRLEDRRIMVRSPGRRPLFLSRWAGKVTASYDSASPCIRVAMWSDVGIEQMFVVCDRVILQDVVISDMPCKPWCRGGWWHLHVAPRRWTVPDPPQRILIQDGADLEEAEPDALWEPRQCPAEG